MKTREIIENLEEKAKKVLSVIGELNGKATAKEIQENSNLDQSTVMRMALQLEEENLIKVTEKTQRKLILTQEGEKYSKNNLPEKTALQIIAKRDSINIDNLSKLTGIPEEKINIAIGWLKRKNWVEIKTKNKNRVLEITQKGRDALDDKKPDEILLEKLHAEESLLTNEIPSELTQIIPDLERRGLIEIKENKSHVLSLTKKGEKILDSGLEIEETVSQLTRELITSGKWREADLREYNVKAPGKPIYPGKTHPQQQVIEELRSILLRMGFNEIKGSYIVPEFWNFDALFQAQNHPAREIHDTFSLSKPNRADIPDKDLLKKVKKAHEEGVAGSSGWGYEFDEELSHKTALCSQTTAFTVRHLAKQPEPPVKVFSIQKVFRRERIDYKHLAEFPQAEGIVMAPGLNFRNMLGYLKQILLEMGIPKVRFRPGYFPYTEPSAEADGYFPEKDEWIELLGAGMFRPELLKPLGIKHPVLAWGIGFSRIAMIRMGIEDMRDLHNNDLEWLKKQTLV
ncbi:MAG: phenylalanine--tRNA ligase subunit alpha [Hadesarchaea archaeon]|nr:phenylalanine--tRNA ligase subunit alpha [Hadesarchaea archaeon]